MSTILMATDGSPSAEKATGKAIELAQATGWRLHFVTVWSLSSAPFGYPPVMYAPYTELKQDNAFDVLRAAVDEARAAGVEATSELHEGIPVEEICAAAEKVGAGMIVIGAHGRGLVKRLVLGSVSNGVVHKAPCPVLVVRGAQEAQRLDLELVGTASETDRHLSRSVRKRMMVDGR
ncbi:MAG TPA: universal stress protein [Gaiellaceae bacterium]|jgi:nucleotide-binding universal stress UspA family protein|nr:universal stress protein [Gaiellaceae bacterium]